MIRFSTRPLLTPQRVGVTLLSGLLLIPTAAFNPEGFVLAHAGHGNEFHADTPSAEAAGAIQVDRETAKRLGLKVEPVSRQRLAFGIKTTGKIEALPNQQVEVTTPVTGTVVKLLVNPGDRVKAGQPVAVMTTPELQNCEPQHWIDGQRRSARYNKPEPICSWHSETWSSNVKLWRLTSNRLKLRSALLRSVMTRIANY